MFALYFISKWLNLIKPFYKPSCANKGYYYLTLKFNIFTYIKLNFNIARRNEKIL